VLTQSAGGRIQSAAAGYSELENHTPMRVDDAFQIASINKTFTAVAVLRLVDLSPTIVHSRRSIDERSERTDRLTTQFQVAVITLGRTQS
jgi:hypothetical protein